MPGTPASAEPAAANGRVVALFPALFVLLWSTGFIAAKVGLPHAPPYQFLFYRFTLVALLMAVVAWAMHAVWPKTLREYLNIAVVAWLVHGVYLGGVFVALADGMAAGTSAMLVGLQPVLTVLLAWAFLAERVSHGNGSDCCWGWRGSIWSFATRWILRATCRDFCPVRWR